MGRGKIAAARSSRKYYLDRVLTVLLSFTLKPKSESVAPAVLSRTESPTPATTRITRIQGLPFEILNTNLIIGLFSRP